MKRIRVKLRKNRSPKLHISSGQPEKNRYSSNDANVSNFGMDPINKDNAFATINLDIHNPGVDREIDMKRHSSLKPGKS